MYTRAVAPLFAKRYGPAAAVAFVILFAVPVALHLGFFVADFFAGKCFMPDPGELLGGNALWAAAWTLLGLLPLAYCLDRWAPSWARSWWPVLALAVVAFGIACMRLAPDSIGTADLLRWTVPEAMLVVMGFLAFRAVAERAR